MYAGRPWSIRQYAGFGTAEETNRRFRFLIEQGQRGALDGVRPADADGDGLRRPAGRGRGRPRRRGHQLGARHGGDVRRHPARRGVDLDDDQRPGGGARRDVLRRLRAPGPRPGADPRHGPERRAQGVRLARHLHLPAAAVAAAGRRRDRVVRRPTRRASTRSRSPATTCARPAARPRRRWRFGDRQRDRLRLGGDRARHRRRRVRAAALVDLQHAHELLRGGRQVPGAAAAVGARDARPLRRDATRAR